MTRADLHKAVEAARCSDAFCHYQQVRERVLDMLEQSQTDEVSPYWQEELAGFDYMLDASPLVIRKLREHCYHITGLRAYEYRSHHSHQQEAFAKKLGALREHDDAGLFVPESPLLGGFGHTIDGALVNIDTLKYYECLIAMDKGGLLAPLRDQAGERRTVMLIGDGWGGLTYQLRSLFPSALYIIVDLPPTLLFSGVYLSTVFPEAKVLMYRGQGEGELAQHVLDHDLVFVPHFAMDHIPFAKLDLAINTVSFQEMTSAQVAGYARRLHELGCPALYSLNRDRSPHNDQLTAVSEILAEYYDLREVKVLGIPYTKMMPDRPPRSLRQVVKSILRRPLRRAPQRSIHDYRHMVGLRRPCPAGHP